MSKYNYTIAIYFLLATQIFLPSTASATNYYVHTNIGDNSNSGLTPENAFADLAYAMKRLSPGDTLYLRSGTYYNIPNVMSPDTSYKSGTAAQPITIKPYQNETPVINSGSTKAITITDLSWWVFEDLVFQDSGGFKLGDWDSNVLPTTDQCKSYAEDITIIRSSFQDSTASGIVLKCAQRIHIQDNLFDNLRSRVAGSDIHAILFQYYAKDVVISGNHFSDIGADGIQFGRGTSAWFSDIQIINNEFEMIHPYTYRDTNGDTVPAHLQPFDSVGEEAIDVKQGPGPIVIEKNVIHGFRPTLPGQDASGSNGAGIVLHMEASGVTLSKNHFYDNVMHLVVSIGSSSSSDHPVRDTVIRNNIFKDVISPGGIYESVTPRVSALRIDNVSSVQILNNTFIQSKDYQNELLFLRDISNVTLLNNVFKNGSITTQFDLPSGNWGGSFDVVANNNAWSRISGEINNNLIGISDVTAGYLMLNESTWSPLEGSILIDAGVYVGITDDINDATISGLGPDIGAGEYQYSVQTGDNQPPVVSITTPSSGTASGIVQINVSASDNTNVDRVKFSIDDVWIGTDSTAPYSITWDTSTHANGKATIKANAYDGAGNASKHTVSVTVDNSGDNEPPTVLITSPSSGAASGIVQINVSASDNINVDRVKFSIDDVWIGTDSTAPYSITWDTSTHANVKATIKANAYDGAGNASKHTVSVTVDNSGDNEPPTVLITSPSSGTASGIVQINVSASDNINVDRVKFSIDDVWIGTDSTAPYSFTWDTSTHANGKATIKANAYDGAGNASKHTVSVTVDNSGDNEPPTVLITSPSSGTASGIVQINVSASDNINVDRVKFSIDDVWIGTDSTAPYSITWDTSTHANVKATIKANAYDGAGNASKHTVSVTVDNSGDNEPPTVLITSPSSGTASGIVQINVSASDNTNVDRVKFSIDDVWIGTDSTAPYSITWDTSTHANGKATIKANAYDGAGNASKHTVSVTVDN